MRWFNRPSLYRIYTGLIICLFLGTPARAQTREQDSLALVALYNSTDGANWTDNTLWLSSTLPVSFWYGVTASGGRVTELILGNNNLFGAIPSEIGNLTNLTELSLYGNPLIDSIPSEIGNLTNLTILNLAYNQLTGSIPSEIGNLLNLQYLIIVSNPITGSIPVEIGNLNQLLVLALSDTQLGGSIPAEIGNLASLTWLDLTLNQLGGAVPVDITDLSNLTDLYLHYNRLTDLPDLSGMTSLATLAVYNNQFTFEDIEPNIGISSIHYSPQDSVGAARDTTIFPAANLILTVPVGGSANVYQWMHDGVDIAGATTDAYDITDAQQADAGAYVLKITNTIATALTLYSRPMSTTVYTDLQVDSLALVALYDSTDGDNWTTPWTLTDPVSTWSGVIISGGRVTYIEIIGNGLAGQIPDEIGNLTALTYLALPDNQLTGTIPDTIRSLPNLTELNLGGNSFPGPIPSWLGSMANLTSLQIYGSELSGEIPDNIGNLTNLTALGLGSNQLTGSIPASLSSLVNLTNLSLGSNMLTGPIPTFIGTFTNLSTLTLNDNQFSGPIPTSLGNLTNVIWFWLMRNQLSGEIPATLGNLASVQYLYLDDNLLTGAIPEQLGNLPAVKSLLLGNNQLVDLPNLTSLTSVTSLAVSGNRLTFEDIEPNVGIIGFTYSPQDSVGAEVDTTVFVGDPLSLSVIVGGSANQYRWKQDGVWITELSGDSSYTISAATFEDSGRYYCTITNTIAGNLTLYSRPIHVSVVVDPFEADSMALVALYNSTGGANWTDNSGWLDRDSALSSWYGITISNGRVDELRLRDNNLTGTIPSEIGDLTALQLLYLGNDSLTGSIPTEIGNLASLTDLSIINSQISGPIPTEIGNLTNLGTISLVGNQLTGSIPSSIGNLVNLWNLLLEGNQLGGPIPSEIGNLINLIRFSAWGNALSDTIPPSIGNLTSLRTLSLSSNQLTGSIPPEIGNDTSLTWLNLSDNQLTGPIPGEIGKLTRLDNLYLNANNLSGTLPPEIGNLASCIYLYLQINNLSGPIPAQISGLISLTNLEMGSNEFTSLPPEISNLTSLESLSLSFNLLDSLPDLSPMSSLSLFLVDNNQLTFEDVIPILGLPIGYIQYAPQDSVGTALDTIIDVGASITLSVDVGGEGNLYTWKRGFDVELNQSTTNFFTISNATVADAGVYHCEITNPGADQLMLISRPMQIGVGGPLAADGPANLPEEYALHSNYPNPFNPSTTVRFDLPQAAEVHLVVYDILGREVVQLVNERLEPGYRQVIWNGRTAHGTDVPTGIYIARLVTPRYTKSIKMVLLK